MGPRTNRPGDKCIICNIKGPVADFYSATGPFEIDATCLENEYQDDCADSMIKFARTSSFAA